MYRRFGKRFFDIVLSTLGLLVFLIILIPVSIAIYLEDRGPIFYNAARLGKGGKVFKMYKFRSMKVNAPDLRKADGSTFNGEDDPRLTKIGKFIRKTSLDEAPQVINVFIGNMSVIGPRPDLPEHINQYVGDEIRKLEVLPGITGYSQAYYRNSIEWKDRIKQDIVYIDNLSLILDIKVFFRTILTVLRKEGVYIDATSSDEAKTI